MGELQDAFARNQETRDKVFASGTAQEVTGAVQKLTDQDKAAVAQAAAKSLSDDDQDRLLAELLALRAARTGTPPANPPN